MMKMSSSNCSCRKWTKASQIVLVLFFVLFENAMTESANSEMESLQQTVSELMLKISELTSKYSALQSALDGLDEPVNALESDGSIANKQAKVKNMLARAPAAFMPQSCADVANMGQTASGLYVIKAKTSTGASTLQSVLCDFSSSPKTTAISNIPSFSTGMVYFHATRSVTMLAAGAVMQFDAIPVSTGQNPFNGATGLFTAPVTGRYQFIFSAVAANYQSQVAVARFSNNAWSNIALAWGQCILQAYPNAGQQYCGYAMVAQVITDLNKGDVIDLYVSSASKDWSYSGGVYAPSTSTPTTQFTGILIEESLSF